MNLVFVAPFFRQATLQFVYAVARLPNARLVLISQDNLEGVPPALRQRLAGHYRVENALDAQHLLIGVHKAQAFLGGIDRLLGTLEHIQIQLGWIRDQLGIAGHGEAVARNFRDKSRMKTALRTAGLPCARHAEVHSARDARQALERIGYPAVYKPREGAAAVSTWRLMSESDLHSAVQKAPPSVANPVVIEEFIQARERSFEVFSVEGRPLWTSVCRYDPPPLTVLENAWIQWTVLLPRETDSADHQAIRQAGLEALSALGMQSGISHMEWFWRDDQSVAISEVAARPPGAQIMALNSYAHDTDFYRIWAEVSVTGEFPELDRKHAVGVAFFRGQGFGKVKAVHGLDKANAQVGELVVEAKLPAVGQWSASGYEGEGFAIVRHPDTEVVESAIRTLIQTVRVEFG